MLKDCKGPREETSVAHEYHSFLTLSYDKLTWFTSYHLMCTMSAGISVELGWHMIHSFVEIGFWSSRVCGVL